MNDNKNNNTIITVNLKKKSIYKFNLLKNKSTSIIHTLIIKLKLNIFISKKKKKTITIIKLVIISVLEKKWGKGKEKNLFFSKF